MQKKHSPAILSNKQRSDNIQKDGSLRANKNSGSKLGERTDYKPKKGLFINSISYVSIINFC